MRSRTSIAAVVGSGLWVRGSPPIGIGWPADGLVGRGSVCACARDVKAIATRQAMSRRLLSFSRAKRDENLLFSTPLTGFIKTDSRLAALARMTSVGCFARKDERSLVPQRADRL